MKLVSILSPKITLKLINLWPPYLFSGIAVISVNEDVSEIVVRKRNSFWNQNYFGTHFGGSLYSMCDPFYAFILLHQLREDHIVWDISAKIEFVKATAKPVFITFSIGSEEVGQIKKQCLDSYKVEPEFSAEILDRDQQLIAKVYKRLYVRRKDAKERFKKS